MQPRYHELSRASSIDEVLEVTRDYLATWSSKELESLPPACRKVRVEEAPDIETWSDRLSEEVRRAILLSEDESRLHRLVSHFLIASVRMRQLGA